MSAVTIAQGNALRPSLSCTSCASRKVKCGRQRPACSACVKRGGDCVYLPEPPPRKRATRRIKDLTEQLRRYEQLLQQNASSTATPATQSDSALDETPESDVAQSGELQLTTRVNSGERSVGKPETSNISADDYTGRRFLESQGTSHLDLQKASSPTVKGKEGFDTRLLKHMTTTATVVSSEDRSKVVDNDLWTRVVEEYGSPEDALDEESSDEGADFLHNDDGYILFSGTKSVKGPQHPPSAHIHEMFETYATNVDPLTKLVHIPTLRPAFRKAGRDLTDVPRGFEALMFAIYAASIMSIKDKECRDRFGEGRRMLYRRFTHAAKVALLRANFMSTISLVVLQALCIYIVAIRDLEESRKTWSLTGIAVRIAQCMGLDRDPDELKLPIFEGEIRRRIWWLLNTHDRRCAELCGLSKFRNIESLENFTRWPVNINDDRLYPGMTVLEPQDREITDMSFLCLRGELTKFATERIMLLKSQGKTPSLFNVAGLLSTQKESMDAIVQLEEIFETRYIRYCDAARPLDLMIMVLGRYAINVTRFLTSHPRRWESIDKIPPPERKMIWDISVKLLEQHTMVLSNPQLQIFAWHAPYFMQWHGFIHTLDALRADPDVSGADRAWQLIEKVYEHSLNMTDDMRKPIHVAVGNLCLKAYAAREESHVSKYQEPLTTPNYIVRLRLALQAMRARTLARRAKSVQNTAVGNTPRSAILLSEDVRAWDKHKDVTHPPDSAHNSFGAQPNNDMFWLDNSLEAPVYDMAFPDLMDIETQFLPNLDGTGMGAAAASTVQIDWAKWDDWLASSNTMGSYLTPPESMQAFK